MLAMALWLLLGTTAALNAYFALACLLGVIAWYIAFAVFLRLAPLNPQRKDEA
jgi:hypothetical protein